MYPTSGNIDLSVGSVVCFTGAVGALMMAAGYNMWIAVAAMLVIGLIIGAVLMGVINLGMSVMGIDQNFQKVVKGLVLLAAVIFDVMSKRNDSR